MLWYPTLSAEKSGKDGARCFCVLGLYFLTHYAVDYFAVGVE
jgi:hypothetical protein